MRKLLNGDQSKRIGNLYNGVEDIKKHRFFKGFDWNALVNGDGRVFERQCRAVDGVQGRCVLRLFRRSSRPMIQATSIATRNLRPKRQSRWTLKKRRMHFRHFERQWAAVSHTHPGPWRQLDLNRKHRTSFVSLGCRLSFFLGRLLDVEFKFFAFQDVSICSSDLTRTRCDDRHQTSGDHLLGHTRIQCPSRCQMAFHLFDLLF